MFLIQMQAPYDTDLLMTINVPDKFSPGNDGTSEAYANSLAAAEAGFKGLV